MNSDTFPPVQALPARVPMFPPTPWLELVPGLSDHPSTSAQRLLAFFDGALFRMLGYIVLLPMLLQHLGPQAFGMLAVTAALFGALSVVQRGLTLETVRRVRAAHHVGDLGRLRALLSSAFGVLALAGAVGGLGGGLLGIWLPGWLGVEPALASVCTAFVCIEAARFGIEQPLAAIEAAAQGVGRAQDIRAARGALTVALFAAGFGVVTAGLGLVALAVLSLVATLAAGFLSWRALRTVLPRVGLRVRRMDLGIARSLSSASLLGAGEAAAALVVCDLDVLIVALVAGMQPVALFAIAAGSCRLFAALAVSISRTIVPAFSGLGAQGQRLRSRWVFRRAMDAALLTSTGFGLLVAAFGARIIGHWLGIRNVPTGLMPALGLLIVTSAPVAVGTQYLSRAGLQARLTSTAGVQLLITALLAITLMVPLGLAGVVWATILAQLVTSAWLAPRLALHHLGIVQRRFWISRAWRLALVATPPGLAALLFSRIKPAHSVRELVLQSGITLILYVVTAFTAWYLLESRPELDID